MNCHYEVHGKGITGNQNMMSLDYEPIERYRTFAEARRRVANLAAFHRDSGIEITLAIREPIADWAQAPLARRVLSTTIA